PCCRSGACSSGTVAPQTHCTGRRPEVLALKEIVGVAFGSGGGRQGNASGTKAELVVLGEPAGIVAHQPEAVGAVLILEAHAGGLAKRHADAGGDRMHGTGLLPGSADIVP